jgi:hypothetical protein
MTLYRVVVGDETPRVSRRRAVRGRYRVTRILVSCARVIGMRPRHESASVRCRRGTAYRRRRATVTPATRAEGVGEAVVRAGP